MSSHSFSPRQEFSRPGVFAWLLLACVLLATLRYGLKASEDRSAFLRWRPQIQQIFHDNIYERFTYPNPPIMALILLPFAALPPMVGSICWFYAKIGMAWLALAWTFRMVAGKDRPFPSWAKGLTVLLSLRPILGDLSHGNVNLFILILVIGALYAFSRGRDFLAGVLLSLSIACKVTPLLFIPYFVWKRNWKVLAGSAVGMLLFLAIVPGIFLGMERNLHLLGSWYGCMVRPFLVGGEVTTEHINQSLPGLLYRLLTHSPSFYDKGLPQAYSNVAAWDPRVTNLLLKTCMAGFALLVLWTCRLPDIVRSGWARSGEWSLVLLGMLLFSERTWKHHCVILMLPFAVLSYYLATREPPRALRTYLVGTLAAVALLMSSTISGFGDRWDGFAKLAEVEGAYVWAYLLLVLALVILLRSQRTAWRAPEFGAGQRFP